MQEIYIENIPVLFSRKNIKNINLRISKPDGQVRVSAPLFASMDTVEKFVSSKADWIIKCREEILSKSKHSSPSSNFMEGRSFASGHTLYLWGKKYVIEIVKSTRWNLQFGTSNSRVNFYVPKNYNDEKCLKFLKKWYKQELLEKSKPIFDKWIQRTGLRPDDICVRYTKTVWGTCNKQKKRIMLNGQLASKDIKYLDYVILHELVHLKYSNHGAAFKDFMTRYMPEWRQLRKELNAD